jgi:hypothetical protein
LPLARRWAQHFDALGVGVLAGLAQGRVLLRMVRHPQAGPWRDISGHLYQMGTRALPITALVGCHCGLRVKPNTQSLGQGTTASVVALAVWLTRDTGSSHPYELSSPTAFASLSYQGITGLAFVQIDDAGQPQARIPPGRSGVPRLPLETSQPGSWAAPSTASASSRSR